jgi:hypothetical protein
MTRERVSDDDLLMGDGDPAAAKRDLPLTRCAWCERYALARDWLTQAELDAVASRGETFPVSHGICPGCLAELRRQG